MSADFRDDDTDTEVDKISDEDSPEITEFDSSYQNEGEESNGEFDIPVLKKRRA